MPILSDHEALSALVDAAPPSDCVLPPFLSDYFSEEFCGPGGHDLVVQRFSGAGQGTNKTWVARSSVCSEQPAIYPRDAGKLVAMFRTPAARMRSCWAHLATILMRVLRNEAAAGSNSSAVTWQPGIFKSHGHDWSAWRAVCRSPEDLEGPLLDFLSSAATLDTTQGAQTKMMLGLNISTPISSHLFQSRWTGAHNASYHVANSFKFVGVVEEWEASIRLLHAQFNMGPVLPAELDNSRPHQTDYVDYSSWPLLPDPVDDHTYALVNQRFGEQLEAFGLASYAVRRRAGVR